MSDTTKNRDEKPSIEAISDLPTVKDDDKVKGGWGTSIPSPSGPIPIPYPVKPK